MIAGVLGTAAGGLLLTFIRKPKDTLLCFLLAFSAGIMLAIVFQDLILEALDLGGLTATLVGISLGVLALFLTTTYIGAGRLPASGLVKTGLFLGIGIALHNLPEGLAIGAGYLSSQKLGLSLALALCLHNIPEGMAMAAPLLAGGCSPTRTVILTILAGIPMGIGALIGALIGTLSPRGLGGTLGFAAGAMLFLVFHELLPEAQQESFQAASTFGAILGILVGLTFLLIL
jgi:ZIP family zinc transporter